MLTSEFLRNILPTPVNLKKTYFFFKTILRGERTVGSSFPLRKYKKILRKIHNCGSWFLPLLLVFIISTDQYLKFLARSVLKTSETISLLGDTVRFTLIENHGGFLGIVSSLPETIRFFLLNFCVFGLLLVCLAYIFLYKNSRVRHSLPLAFVTGGGISNLLDRLFHSGGVTDFVSIGMGTLRTGIFNLADVYILAGSFVLGFMLFYFPVNSHHKKED